MAPKVTIRPRYRVGTSGKHLAKGKDVKEDLSEEKAEFCFVKGGIARISELEKPEEAVRKVTQIIPDEAIGQHEAEKKAREQKLIADEAARRAREENLGKSA